MNYDEKGLMRLHLAIVRQAVIDFQKSQDRYLRDWLLRDGLHILECYEQPIERDKWTRLVNDGFPDLERLKRI